MSQLQSQAAAPSQEVLDLFKFDFDPKALKAKYLEERDKRLNPKGNDQYTWILPDNEFSYFLTDPWADPIKREAVKQDVTVLVLGGGFSGMVSTIKLLEAGITDVKIIEKGGDFGGTWYWNRYPGAACDSEAYCYLPMLQETNYMPVSKYTRAPEILAHCGRMGRQWNLYDRTFFQTECTEAKWDEEAARWICTTDQGDVFRARFLIAASGPLHKPKLPQTPGIGSFKGVMFHTSRWNYDYTGGSSFGSLTKLADKRVAFVGTGATAIQAVPYLAESAKELYVVQRTPSAVEWRENKATDEKWWKEYSKTPGWQYERDRNFTLLTSNFPVDVDLVNDAWTSLPKEQMSMLDARERFGLGKEYSPEDLMQMADFRRMNKIRDLVGELVKDKATAEALKPWYNRWCKRPTFSDTYLQSFNRPSVKLLDTQGKGLDRVTEKGIVVNGKEYEVDCIIWGTGFEIGTSWKQRNGFELIGRDGMTLQKKWRAGMKSLFGIATRALPNFYMYQNAQAGASFNLPWIYYRQAEWTVEVIKRTLDKGAAYFEVTDEAEKDWQKTIVEKSLLRKEFLTECTPGYYNFEGQTNRLVARNTSYGEGPIKYADVLAEWIKNSDSKGLEFVYRDDGAKAKL